MFLNMKKLSVLAAALALAACSANGGMEQHGRDHGHRHGGGGYSHKHDGDTFQCKNGLAPKIHVHGDKLMLQLDAEKAVLMRAAAASGELFTTDKGLFGKRTEWHQKGGNAVFGFTDPYGNKVQTVCED